MRYLCGDPWSDEDRKARAGRPCISHDELNQYVFQCVNAARENRRGIKIEPAGNGATDKTALLREDIARTIEYRSKAQAVYLQGYQDCVEGAYGFMRISRRYVSDDSDEQEIVIKPIPNPDSVLYDPDCKEADWADARGVFVLDPIQRKDFIALYPEADVVDFSDDDGAIRRDWIKDDSVLVAEYWKLKITRVKSKSKSGRMVEKKEVIQYITNGVQILETNPQPGKEIPIVPFIGLQRFVKEGGNTTRKLFALCSFALDPQLTLAYLSSQQMEEAGMSPKSPYMGYVGQFESDREAWEALTKVPVAFIQVDPIPDGSNGQILPLPQRVQFTPNFAAYEVAKESTRRAIQASTGISPLPTQAQRQNEKSGVALQSIKAAQDTGSYHFVAGFERGITRGGRIIDSWIPVVYDTEREIGLHQVNDTRKLITVGGMDEETGEKHDIGEGDHDVTIGTGPSQDSQREAASDFLDLLVGNIEKIPPPGSPQAKLLSLAIQMKNLGPKGDEMAEIISPTQEGQQIPPEAQQAIQQGQQQVQQLHAYAQQLEQKVGQLEFEKKAQVVKHQGDMELEKLKLENDLAKAEIATKAQSTEERLRFVEDMYKQLHDQAHDIAKTSLAQLHTQDNADQQAQIQQEQMAQQPEPANA